MRIKMQLVQATVVVKLSNFNVFIANQLSVVIGAWNKKVYYYKVKCSEKERKKTFVDYKFIKVSVDMFCVSSTVQ